jgi:Bacterial regulatory helix-turn-helix protein, lysR family
MHKSHAMNAFVRVVELGSFTKAARSLGIAKTHMSRAIVMLEQKICRKNGRFRNSSVCLIYSPTLHKARHNILGLRHFW